MNKSEKLINSSTVWMKFWVLLLHFVKEICSSKGNRLNCMRAVVGCQREISTTQLPWFGGRALVQLPVTPHDGQRSVVFPGRTDIVSTASRYMVIKSRFAISHAYAGASFYSKVRFFFPSIEPFEHERAYVRMPMGSLFILTVWHHTNTKTFGLGLGYMRSVQKRIEVVTVLQFSRLQSCSRISSLIGLFHVNHTDGFSVSWRNFRCPFMFVYWRSYFAWP